MVKPTEHVVNEMKWKSDNGVQDLFEPFSAKTFYFGSKSFDLNTNSSVIESKWGQNNSFFYVGHS